VKTEAVIPSETSV